MGETKAPRQRPAADFGKLRRRAGEVMAQRNADGGNPIAELQEIDRETWPVILAALAQCRDGATASETNVGKLHGHIADFLIHAIESGLDGKLPLSWPEPTGQRAAVSSDATAADIAALYLAARKEGLLVSALTDNAVADLFGITTRQLDNWSKQTKVAIVRVGNSLINLSCYGYTIHYGLNGSSTLDSHLEKEMREVAVGYRSGRGRSKK